MPSRFLRTSPTPTEFREAECFPEHVGGQVDRTPEGDAVGFFCWCQAFESIDETLPVNDHASIGSHPDLEDAEFGVLWTPDQEADQIGVPIAEENLIRFEVDAVERVGHPTYLPRCYFDGR